MTREQRDQVVEVVHRRWDGARRISISREGRVTCTTTAARGDGGRVPWRVYVGDLGDCLRGVARA